MIKKFLKEFDLTLTVLFTLLCMIFVFNSPLNEVSIRTLLGLFLILFLPGYSLIATVFPRKNDLDGLERFALSIGVSVALAPLVALGLNYTQFEIRLAPILIILSIFTVSLSLVAWVRRMKIQPKDRFRIPFERLLKVNLGQGVMDKGLSIVLIASIIGSSATLVYVVVTPRSGERFTEFYLLGPNGTASDYPTYLKVGEEGKMILVIINHEYENSTYRLEVIFNGSVIHEENVFLVENKKWEGPFTFKARKKGENQKLEFILYKDQQREAYRTLQLWITVT